MGVFWWSTGCLWMNCWTSLAPSAPSLSWSIPFQSQSTCDSSKKVRSKEIRTSTITIGFGRAEKVRRRCGNGIGTKSRIRSWNGTRMRYWSKKVEWNWKDTKSVLPQFFSADFSASWPLVNSFRLGRGKGRFFSRFAINWISVSGWTRKRKHLSVWFAREMRVCPLWPGTSHWFYGHMGSELYRQSVPKMSIKFSVPPI
jgi:hypothetical protein